MTKILVTGGAGFIGFHVSKALVARGDEVVIVDNFNDYYDVGLKEARAKELFGATIIRADISDYKTMNKIFETHSFDKVCHLAAQAGVRYSVTNPFVYERSNILGTLNLLELCRNHGVKDFVFASSSSVYGNNKKLPFSEDDRVDNPISLYAATKKSNEEMAYVYHQLYNLNCTGLRFFTVYGPYGRPDMALFLFTKAIIEGQEVAVFNNGEMARDFTYISDIVSGVLAAIDKPFGFEIFNLARGESIRLLDFISEIEKNFGVLANKKFLPIQLGDVSKTSADISKAKKLLGYNPKTSISVGVKQFIDWYKSFYKVV
ncbi:MAG: SDR family NAD(P)-dependent oxidoreductase [Nanoarchaeota archaeon]|nr:SDR family NAD(P)-dependent oxidoreductase [Nanoarchaeota archaeon]MBU1030903.1 SDR family NAD(P)-dependent oxidoreductase [Nanoarchaeota archaeon]MBU1850704.1 SDR family NAD(P)-dependent oxidoreductase [Nanoarchaeota archaeon]